MRGGDEVDAPTLTLVIALIGCVVGVAGWLHTSNGDASDQAASTAEIKTKLEFIGNDTKDIRAKLSRYEEDMRTVRQTADVALARANAANDRLDAYGVPSAANARSVIQDMEIGGTE